MDRGYIKLWRKTMDNPHMRNPKALALWVRMLSMATHKPYDVLWKGQRLTLQPGQFTAGRNQLAIISGVNPSSVQRIIERLKTEHQIEQQTSNVCSLFTITNWGKYQHGEQPNEQQTNSRRTAGEQPANTKQEHKHINTETQNKILSVVEHLNKTYGSRFLPTAYDTARKISGRLADGFTVEDMRRVIDYKVEEWADTEWAQYLRPKTLFSQANFEGYLSAATKHSAEPGLI